MNECIRRIEGVALALALGGSLLGCNQARPLETIRGKVAYKGQPLPWGFLHFYSGTNFVGLGVIKPDGSGEYEASIPAGPVQVLVKEDPAPDRNDSLPGVGHGQPPASPQAKLLEEIVKKYGSRKTARPLTFDVAPGAQTWNINLD